MYPCHLFLISSASVRFIPLLSFIEPIFAWNVPLETLIFLKRSLVFPIPLFSSISLHWSLRKAFLSLLALLWNSAFKWVPGLKCRCPAEAGQDQPNTANLQTLGMKILVCCCKPWRCWVRYVALLWHKPIDDGLLIEHKHLNLNMSIEEEAFPKLKNHVTKDIPSTIH